MTISILELSRALKKGLTIEEYVYMACQIDGSLYIFDPKTFTSTQINLRLKDYVNSLFEVNPKGKALIREIQEEKEVVKKDNFYVNLHKKLQSELQILTGRKQKVLNGKYSFLCGVQDLSNKLSETVKKYKLTDLDRVEKLLLRYIHTCYKADFHMTPLIEYYISKNKSSKLATDYFDEDTIQETKKTPVFDL